MIPTLTLYILLSISTLCYVITLVKAKRYKNKADMLRLQNDKVEMIIHNRLWDADEIVSTLRGEFASNRY